MPRSPFKELAKFIYDNEQTPIASDLRKVRPLARAMERFDASITGRKGFQSATRRGLPRFEIDISDAEGRLKINPLADYDLETLKDLVVIEDIPINPLHQRGFPSIGCEPCTRAIKPGEPERAGRWWWENDEKRECGLHVSPAATTLNPPAGHPEAGQPEAEKAH